MESKILVCDCNSAEHQIIINYDEEDKELSCQIHLTKYSFFKRLFISIKYIFGYTSKYGDWDEFIFKKEHIIQIKDILEEIEKSKDNDIFIPIRTDYKQNISLFGEELIINEYKKVSNDYITKILNKIPYYFLEDDFLLNLDKSSGFKILINKSTALNTNLQNNYIIRLVDTDDKCVYLSKPYVINE